jgi:uncharacterized protein YcbK (DUF882 family)
MTFKKESQSAISYNGISRRVFLTAGLAATVACLLPFKVFAAAPKDFFAERALSFYNTHTGESMKTVYWTRGAYVPEALADINYILRDYRTGGVKEIDTDLLDLLFAIHRKLESTAHFNIISGYRSQETNSFLNIMSNGVVKDSLHIHGKAIDIRLPGHELKVLRRAAVDLQRGGVGYYPSSDFVHIDVGRIRNW